MQKRRYRLKPGQKHFFREGRGMHMHSGDDVRSRDIELWPRQARGIRDKLIPLDKDEPEAQAAVEIGPADTAPPHTLRHVGGGRYNVIHPETGEAINDAPLSKVDAEALAAGGGKVGGDTDDD